MSVCDHLLLAANIHHKEQPDQHQLFQPLTTARTEANIFLQNSVDMIKLTNVKKDYICKGIACFTSSFK